MEITKKKILLFSAVLLTFALLCSLSACGAEASVSESTDTYSVLPPADTETTEPFNDPAPDGKKESDDAGSLIFSGSVEDPVLLDDTEIPPFCFEAEGVDITAEVMASYPVYSVTTTSTNTYGTVTTRTYVGYAVSDILDAAGITDDFSALTALADDGYMVKIERNTALEPTTLIAVSEDGKLFKSGPWFAPCGSNVSPDYLRELVSVSVEQ